MPDQNDSDDLDLDLDEDEPADDADGGDTDEPADDTPPKKDEADKRTRELQSAADKATARANKLEKELKRLRGEGGAPASSGDPERAALLAELRESGLDAIFAENPELRNYGIDRDLISGATRAEMREQATQFVTLIKSVETKVRNETLRKHGITPEPGGTTKQPAKNYAEMSAEDIEKEISRVKSGGVPGLW